MCFDETTDDPIDQEKKLKEYLSKRRYVYPNASLDSPSPDTWEKSLRLYNSAS
jgi:hypothetical protein